jgi:hypothetical protein
VNTEVDVLLGALDVHRRHAMGIIEDLSDEQLRSPCTPSRWCPLGMILHLAASEHYWLHCMFAGLPADLHGQRTTELDLWDVSEDDRADEIFALYRHQIDESNQLVRASTLDTAPKVRDAGWREGDFGTLRIILALVSGHTATHAGHLDVAREFIDGRQWMVL